VASITQSHTLGPDTWPCLRHTTAHAALHFTTYTLPFLALHFTAHCFALPYSATFTVFPSHLSLHTPPLHFLDDCPFPIGYTCACLKFCATTGGRLYRFLDMGGPSFTLRCFPKTPPHLLPYPGSSPGCRRHCYHHTTTRTTALPRTFHLPALYRLPSPRLFGCTCRLPRFLPSHASHCFAGGTVADFFGFPYTAAAGHASAPHACFNFCLWFAVAWNAGFTCTPLLRFTLTAAACTVLSFACRIVGSAQPPGSRLAGLRKNLLFLPTALLPHRIRAPFYRALLPSFQACWRARHTAGFPAAHCLPRKQLEHHFRFPPTATGEQAGSTRPSHFLRTHCIHAHHLVAQV